MSEQRKRDVLKELIERYAADIAGQFNPAVYKLTTGCCPLDSACCSRPRTFKTSRPAKLPQVIKQLRNLEDRVVMTGTPT